MHSVAQIWTLDDPTIERVRAAAGAWCRRFLPRAGWREDYSQWVMIELLTRCALSFAEALRQAMAAAAEELRRGGDFGYTNKSRRDRLYCNHVALGSPVHVAGIRQGVTVREHARLPGFDRLDRLAVREFVALVTCPKKAAIIKAFFLGYYPKEICELLSLSPWQFRKHRRELRAAAEAYGWRNPGGPRASWQQPQGPYDRALAERRRRRNRRASP